MATRREILRLLRGRPGITASELADSLTLTSVAVRRHLTALVDAGLVERLASTPSKVGRPPAGWRLSPLGREQLPRDYDTLALGLLEDLAEEAGPAAVDAVLARRNDKLAEAYGNHLDPADGLAERVAIVARLRDEAGYVAESSLDRDGHILLVENNCAVHRVAENHPVLCAMELSLLERVLGPDVEVTRTSHAVAGDAVCCYRIKPRNDLDGG